MLGWLDLIARARAKRAAARPHVTELLKSVRSANLTYVGMAKLRRLAEMILLVRNAGIEGSYLEAGVALGGSAVIIAKLKPPFSSLSLYDVFEMIPPPGVEDERDAHDRYELIRSGQSQGLGADRYYGYRGDLRSTVIANLQAFGVDLARDNVELTRGLFQETLHPAGLVAFAHVDCDWHEPIRTCLDRIVPKLSPGGVLLLDDYGSYAGARKAIDTFIDGTDSLEILFRERSLAIRKRNRPRIGFAAGRMRRSFSQDRQVVDRKA